VNYALKLKGVDKNMATRRNVYEMIFARLQKIGILDENGEMTEEYKKFESFGMMDLHVDNLAENTISIAHNGRQNGDCMADPDMEIRIYPETNMAEALTFRNDYVGVNQVVYPEPGKFYPKLKKELNAFLNGWLKNMIEVQGFKEGVKTA